MTWADLIIILFTVSLTMVMNHLDTMPGYSCPKHCGVDHKHFPLDVQSDWDPLLAENVSEVKTGTYACKKRFAY